MDYTKQTKNKELTNLLEIILTVVQNIKHLGIYTRAKITPLTIEAINQDLRIVPGFQNLVDEYNLDNTTLNIGGMVDVQSLYKVYIDHIEEHKVDYEMIALILNNRTHTPTKKAMFKEAFINFNHIINVVSFLLYYFAEPITNNILERFDIQNTIRYINDLLQRSKEFRCKTSLETWYDFKSELYNRGNGLYPLEDLIDYSGYLKTKLKKFEDNFLENSKKSKRGILKYNNDLSLIFINEAIEELKGIIEELKEELK